MPYRVRFAPDHLMPEGRAWVICRDSDVTTLYLRASAQNWTTAEKERHLEAAWAGYREMTDNDPSPCCYISSETASPKESMAAL